MRHYLVESKVDIGPIYAFWLEVWGSFVPIVIFIAFALQPPQFETWFPFLYFIGFAAGVEGSTVMAFREYLFASRSRFL